MLTRLAENSFNVSLETSGAINIADVDSRIIKVMDLKIPSSNEEQRNLYQNVEYLDAKDQVKFVIADHKDYLWSKKLLAKYQLHKRCEVLFSPCTGSQNYNQLAEWILADQLPVRFQLQLHKILWGDVAGK